MRKAFCLPFCLFVSVLFCSFFFLGGWLQIKLQVFTHWRNYKDKVYFSGISVGFEREKSRDHNINLSTRGDHALIS